MVCTVTPCHPAGLHLLMCWPRIIIDKEPTSGRETLIFIQKTERKLKENEIPVMAFISGPCLLNLIL